MRYQDNIFIIILSLIFAFPLGLFLLWKNQKLKLFIKIILTLFIFSSFFIFNRVELYNRQNTENAFVSENMVHRIMRSTTRNELDPDNLGEDGDNVGKSHAENNESKNANRNSKDFDEGITVSDKDNSENLTKKSKTVYITPTGKKYHYSKSCGSGNYIAITLEEAEKKGYKPCKKCVK